MKTKNNRYLAKALLLSLAIGTSATIGNNLVYAQYISGEVSGNYIDTSNRAEILSFRGDTKIEATAGNNDLNTLMASENAKVDIIAKKSNNITLDPWDNITVNWASLKLQAEESNKIEFKGNNTFIEVENGTLSLNAPENNISGHVNIHVHGGGKFITGSHANTIAIEGEQGQINVEDNDSKVDLAAKAINVNTSMTASNSGKIALNTSGDDVGEKSSLNIGKGITANSSGSISLTSTKGSIETNAITANQGGAVEVSATGENKDATVASISTSGNGVTTIKSDKGTAKVTSGINAASTDASTTSVKVTGKNTLVNGTVDANNTTVEINGSGDGEAAKVAGTITAHNQATINVKADNGTATVSDVTTDEHATNNANVNITGKTATANVVTSNAHGNVLVKATDNDATVNSVTTKDNGQATVNAEKGTAKVTNNISATGNAPGTTTATVTGKNAAVGGNVDATNTTVEINGSSDGEAAKVTGLITAHGDGTINVKADNGTATVSDVATDSNAANNANVNVTGKTAGAKDITVNAHGNVLVKATDNDATVNSVTTKDNGQATVNAEKGTAKITNNISATGNAPGTTTATVTGKKAEVGGTVDATNTTVEINGSSDEEAAKVTGLITAHGDGTINVKADNGTATVSDVATDSNATNNANVNVTGKTAGAKDITVNAHGNVLVKAADNDATVNSVTTKDNGQATVNAEKGTAKVTTNITATGTEAVTTSVNVTGKKTLVNGTVDANNTTVEIKGKGDGEAVTVEGQITAHDAGTVRVSGDNGTATVNNAFSNKNGTISVNAKDKVVVNGNLDAINEGLIDIGRSAEKTILNGKIGTTAESDTPTNKGRISIRGTSILAKKDIVAGEKREIVLGYIGQSISNITANSKLGSDKGTLTVYAKDLALTPDDGSTPSIEADHNGSTQVTTQKVDGADALVKAGNGGTVNVTSTGDELSKVGNVTSENSGSVSLTSTGELTTKAVTSTGKGTKASEVQINTGNGKTLTVDSVSVEQGGTANLNTDPTSTGAITINNNISNDSGTLTVGNDKSGVITISGTDEIKADNGGTTKITGSKLSGAEFKLTADKGSSVNVKTTGDEETKLSDVKADNGSKVEVNSAGDLTTKAVTSTGKGTDPSEVKINAGNAKSLTVDSVTVEKGGTANLNTEATSKGAITVNGNISNDSGTLTVGNNDSGVITVNNGGITADNSATTNIYGSQINGENTNLTADKGSSIIVKTTGTDASKLSDVKADNGAKVEINSTNADLTTKAVTSTGKGTAPSEVQINTGNGKALTVDSVTVEKGSTTNLNTDATSTGAITINNNISNDGGTLTIGNDKSGVITIKGTDGIKADNSATTNISGSQIKGDQSKVTADHGSSINVKTTGTDATILSDIKSDNGGAVTVEATNGKLTTGKLTSDSNKSVINLKGQTVTTGDIATNGGTINLQSLANTPGAENDVVTGNVSATGDNSEVNIQGQKVKADTLTAKDKAIIVLKADTEATIDKIEQESGSIVQVNSAITHIKEHNGNDSAIYLNKLGEVLDIDKLSGTKTNTIAMGLSVNPEDSNYLIVKEAPKATQNLEWLALNNKSTDATNPIKEVEAAFLKNKQTKQGAIRIPFASVLNPGNVDLFNLKTQPQIRFSNGLEKGNLNLGKTTANKLGEKDQAYIKVAGDKTGLTNELLDPKSEVYYATVGSVGIDETAQSALNSIAAMGLDMATDMVPSVRAGLFGDMLNGNNDLWARYSNTRMDHEGAKLQRNQVEVGGAITKGEAPLGIALEYNRAHGEIAGRLSDLSSNKAAVKFYQTRYLPKGHYANFVLGGGRVSNTFSFDNDGTNVAGDYKQNFVLASGEYGLRKTLANGWYAIPQIQVQYTYVGSGNAYVDDATVHFGAVNSVKARLGTMFAKDITTAKGKTKVYGSLDVFHEFAGKQTLGLYGVGDNTWNRQKTGTWFKFGLGVNADISKVATTYVDVAKSFGGNAPQSYDINVGARFKF